MWRRWRCGLTVIAFIAVVADRSSNYAVNAHSTSGRFQFAQAVYHTTKDFGVAYVTVQRSLGCDGRAAVGVSTVPGGGTAVDGQDFKSIYNVSLVWQDGEDSENSLYVPIYNDGTPQENPKTFRLKLHDAFGAVINLDRDEATLILDPPSNRKYGFSCCFQLTSGALVLPGSFSFTSAAANIAEGNVLTMPVIWVGGTTSSANISFEFVCKTACWSDFELLSPTSQQLQWKHDGDLFNSTNRTQYIVLRAVSDGLYEPPESFTVGLRTIAAGVGDTIGTGTIASIGEMLVTIDGPNDAQPGTLQFDSECFSDCPSTKYSIDTGGTALILLQRRNGSDGDCSVIFATQDITAVAGLDYNAIEREVLWKEGDNSVKQIIVTSLARSDPPLPSRRIALVLKSSSGAPINAHSSTSFVDITSLTGSYLGDVNFAARDPRDPELGARDLGFMKFASRNTSSRLQLCPTIVVTKPGPMSIYLQRTFVPYPVPAQVTVKTIAGTATPDLDFEPLRSTVVRWPIGDSGVKQVFLKVLTPPSYDPYLRSLWLQLFDVHGARVGDCNVLEVVLVGIARSPHVVSFGLDMTIGILTLQLSVPVQAMTMDVRKLLLQSERKLRNGPTFKFSPQQVTSRSPDGTTIVLNIGSGDLDALKRIVGLAKNANSTFLGVDSGLFQYILDNCESTGTGGCTPGMTGAIPNTDAMPVTNFIADTVSPTLLGFSLELSRQLLKLHFSEAVNDATLKVEALTFSEAVAGSSIYRLSSATTRLFLPHRDPLSDATLRDANHFPSDNTFLTLQLGSADVTALGSFGSGRIGIKREYTFLGMDSSFVEDFAGNPAKCVGPPGALLQTSATNCSTCPAGSYLTSSCSDLKDRICTTCSVCPTNSYAIEACQATQDTLCYPCTECRAAHYVSVPCSPTTDRVCLPCTRCTLDEYEVSACAAGADRVCQTCNSCTLTTSQQLQCQHSPMWKRLQMRLPFSCPQPGQQYKTREEQLQRAKSNRCGSGRCSCVATGIPGNSNPSGKGFPNDPRCTGPVEYDILV